MFTEEDRKDGVPEQELETARERGSAADERWHRRKDGSLFYVTGTVVAAARRGRRRHRVRQDRARPHRAEAVPRTRCEEAQDDLEERVLERTRDLELEKSVSGAPTKVGCAGSCSGSSRSRRTSAGALPATCTIISGSR